MDKGNEQKKFLVKIVCVILSFGLWLYVTNVENPTRTYDLKNVPVELENVDSLEKSNFALEPNQKYYVDLKLEGPANDVYSVKPEDIKIKADLSAYALKKGENNIPVQIISYPNNISIKTNSYLVAKVKIEELVKKEFTVESNVKLNFKDNFSNESSVVNPEKITIRGAESVVNRVAKVVLQGEVNDIDKNFSTNFPIKAIDSNGAVVDDVELSNSEGSLSVSVGIKKSVEIKSKIIGNVKEGFELSNVELSKNNVTIVGDSQIVKDIGYIETEEINVSDLSESKTFTVKLNLPNGVEVNNNEEYITVNVTVKAEDEITKTVDNVPVSFENLKEELNVSEAKTVSITLKGKKGNLSNVSADNIKVTVDLSSVEGVESQKEVSWQAKLGDGISGVTIENSTGQITIDIVEK